MSVEEREKTQYDWTHGRVQIIAATIAFGMGQSLASAVVTPPFSTQTALPRHVFGYTQLHFLLCKFVADCMYGQNLMCETKQSCLCGFSTLDDA